jgi:hypothetical protein
MALESTQPLTEMSTTNIPVVKGRLARKSDRITAVCEFQQDDQLHAPATLPHEKESPISIRLEAGWVPGRREKMSLPPGLELRRIGSPCHTQWNMSIEYRKQTKEYFFWFLLWFRGLVMDMQPSYIKDVMEL